MTEMVIMHNKENKKALETLTTKNQAGFTLVETIIAMMVFLIALLGVFATFAYAVSYNMGNNLRSQALTVLQKEAELLRSAKFTPDSTKTDAALKGGVKPVKTVTSEDNTSFAVLITVDDDPFIDLVQIDPTKTLKEITIEVKSTNSTNAWYTAVPNKLTLRRVQSN